MKQCVHCGAAIEAPTKFCAQCGFPTADAPAHKSPARIIFAVFLGMLALLLGAMGACFGIFGLGTSKELQGLALIGLLCFGLSALCVWGVFKLVK